VKGLAISRIFPSRRAHALLFGVAALLALAGVAGCGSRDQTQQNTEVGEQAPPPVNPDAKPVDPATAGTISGIVHLEGTPPTMRAINMRSVPSCDKMHATPPTLEDVVPGDNGTLQNVVVYLKGDFTPYSFPAATEPVKIDQLGCLYVPHVVAATIRTPVQVHNSDSVTHNSTTITKVNAPWNETQSVGSAPVERVFSVPEIALALKCSVHPWMKVYMAIFSHPYFQVTGKDGSFSLKNVPPGSYTLSAWQERYGTMEQQVTLAPKGEQTVTFTFKAGG
jgi:Carboxypeptidase regulatory-like domain